MDLALQPHRIQSWFDDSWLLVQTAEFWTSLMGYPVSPFRAFVLDLVTGIVVFYLIVVGVWVKNKIGFMRQGSSKYHF